MPSIVDICIKTTSSDKQMTVMTIVHIGTCLALRIDVILTIDSPIQIPRRNHGRAQAEVRDGAQEAQVSTMCERAATRGWRSIDNRSH